MLYNYSITPLSENEFEKRAEDIITQVKRGAFSMPLFMMILVPEGDPVWDKAGPAAKLYARYRDRLAKEGVEAGILIQASLGDGYEITHAPFQTYVGLSDADGNCCPDGVQTTNSYCPYDKGFLAHFSEVMRTLAKEHPKAIMLDDDFRLMHRSGRGCACPLHMAEFNRRTGLNWTREDLWKHVSTHPASDPITTVFEETQRDSMVEAAKVFRAAMDEIDPSIQGINCTSGHICEAVDFTNKVFAGKGNPTMVRVPNGCYAPYSVREFAKGIINAAICSRRLKKRGIDILLAETDTIPFNRYAKSARHLHAHFVSSILEGLKGAKHWLTRTSAFEPESGKAYRDILAEHNKMYEKLADISDDIKWLGVSATFTEQKYMKFSGNVWYNYIHDIVEKNLERMGMPFYLSDDAEKLNFIEGKVAEELTDEQLSEMFKTSVFCDGLAAQIFCERGYGEKLGVRANEWDLGVCHGETFDGSLYQCCTKQKDMKKLVSANPATKALSHNYFRKDGYAELLAPAVTCLDRGEGRLSVVFCGSFTYSFDYMQGFAFLNESRKAQFVSLFSRAGALPIYCVGDEEICFKAGILPDERIMASVCLLGIDPAEGLSLFLEKEPEEITKMLPDGSEAPVSFTEKGDGVYTLDIRLETLYPAILFIK